MPLPRIITGILGIALVVAAIYFGGIFFMAFVFAIIMACLYEYGLVLLVAEKPVSRTGLIIFGALMTVAALAGRMPDIVDLPSNISGFFIAISLFGLFFLEMFSKKPSFERVANTFLGIMFIPWCLAHLINIRMIEPYGEYFTYILFFSVWANDTAAYAIGCWLGKHRLKESVSPKKSWEGSIAGFVFAIAVAYLSWDFYYPGLTWQQIVALGACIAVLAQVSDLAESLFKRGAGVKDSSHILPGHGGVLDRFDAMLLSAPVVYYLILLMI
jgi:phosphatidate cytidylyltransferase